MRPQPQPRPPPRSRRVERQKTLNVSLSSSSTGSPSTSSSAAAAVRPQHMRPLLMPVAVTVQPLHSNNTFQYRRWNETDHFSNNSMSTPYTRVEMTPRESYVDEFDANLDSVLIPVRNKQMEHARVKGKDAADVDDDEDEVEQEGEAGAAVAVVPRRSRSHSEEMAIEIGQAQGGDGSGDPSHTRRRQSIDPLHLVSIREDQVSQLSWAIMWIGTMLAGGVITRLSCVFMNTCDDLDTDAVLLSIQNVVHFGAMPFVCRLGTGYPLLSSAFWIIYVYIIIFMTWISPMMPDFYIRSDHIPEPTWLFALIVIYAVLVVATNVWYGAIRSDKQNKWQRFCCVLLIVAFDLAEVCIPSGGNTYIAVHHWFIGRLLSMVCFSEHWTGTVGFAINIGVFVQGTAAYGADPVRQVKA